MLQLALQFEEPGPVGGLSEEDSRERIEAAYETAASWSALLAERLQKRVRLVITDNRRTMLSAESKDGRLEVRLHHMFLDGGPEIFEAIARYLRSSDRRASRRIDAFIEVNRDRVAESADRGVILRTAGEHHDLQEIFDDLAIRHFGGFLGAKITWGRRITPKRGQRSLQMGNYIPSEKLIRIHPALDQDWVPRFFVEAVVFHEMLHHDMPAVVHNGRHNFHTPEFRRRERSFEYHCVAEQWEKKNFRRLLRGR